MNKIIEGLTGNHRYRVGFRNCLVLQVEEAYHIEDMHGESPQYKQWRDARMEDLEIKN